MPIEYAPRIVERHFGVSDEQQLLAGGVLDHNLRVACIAKALLNAQPVPPAALAVPMPEPALPIVPHARPSDMRSRLGLG